MSERSEVGGNDRGEYVITDAQLAAISGASLAEVTLLLEREAERRHLELAIERVTNGTRISWRTRADGPM